MKNYKIIKDITTLEEVKGLYEEDKIRSFVDTELAVTNLKNNVQISSTGFVTTPKTIRYIKHLQSKVNDERTFKLYHQHTYQLLLADALNIIPIVFNNKTVVVDYEEFKKQVKEEKIDYNIEESYSEYLWNIVKER